MTVTPGWHTALMMNLMSESQLESLSETQCVTFEVCEAFRSSIEHDEPVCAACGHLAEDHERLVAA